MKELSQMSGKNIFRIKVQRIDYKRNMAIIEIFYKS